MSSRVVQLGRGYVVACFGLCLGLAVMGWAGTSAFSELLRYLPWLLATPLLLLACVIGAWLGRSWLAMAMLSGASFVFGVLGFSTALGAAKLEQGFALRVMTWNVEGFAAKRRAGGLAQIGWEIALHDPDILMLQDSNFSADQVPHAIRERMRDGYASSMGQYLLISRWPIGQCATGRIDHSNEPHTFQHCTITVQGRRVKLVNVHLFTPRDGLSAVRSRGPSGWGAWSVNMAARLQQAERLAAELALESDPVIVAGDLNVTQRSPVLRTLLAAQLRDTHREAGFGFGHTFGHALRSGVSFLRLDHVLVSSHFQVLQWARGTADASDHRAVVVDLQLR